MAVSDSQTRAISRRGLLLLAVAALALLGVADGIYLTLVHVDYQVGKASELTQTCGALAAHGCAVTTGRFGDIAGIPVSAIGMGGATATMVTAILAWGRRAAAHDSWRGTTFLLAATSVAVSVLMGILSTLEGSYCPFCLAWYGINFAMGVLAWLALGPGQDTSPGRMIDDVVGAPGLVAAVAMAGGLLIGYQLHEQRRASLLAEYAEISDRAARQFIAEQPRVPISLEGLPTAGPEDAPLTIVEVADFQCPHCRKLWDAVHAYREHGQTPVRVAFIHYPLDDACNPGVQGIHEHACLAARAAECARQQDRFWEYGDALFGNQPALAREDLRRYAGELGLDTAAFDACLDGGDAEREVLRSIARGIELDVKATPTFFINGIRHEGAPSPERFPIMLDALAKAFAAEGEGGDGGRAQAPSGAGG